MYVPAAIDWLRQDYDDAALLRIMRKMAAKKRVQLSLDVARAAVGQLARSRAMPNFGNAGSVRNMLDEVRYSLMDSQRC